jgi:hypothetical protein
LKTKSSHPEKAIQQIDLMEQRGISSFILDTIKHRDYFTNNMTRIYAGGKEMKAALKEQEYQNRVFDNYIVLLVTVKCCKTNSTFLLRMINQYY